MTGAINYLDIGLISFSHMLWISTVHAHNPFIQPNMLSMRDHHRLGESENQKKASSKYLCQSKP